MEYYTPGNTLESVDPQIVELLQRLFHLKNRLKVGLPENLIELKQRLNQANLGSKTGGIHDFDLFYHIGIIFSRHCFTPITMGELSQALDVPLSTATRIMDWLVKNDYAQRLPDSDDRRVVRVALTGSGQEMYRMIDDFFMERIGRFISQFTPEERLHLLSLLRKFIQTIEKEP